MKTRDRRSRRREGESNRLATTGRETGRDRRGGAGNTERLEGGWVGGGVTA